MTMQATRPREPVGLEMVDIDTLSAAIRYVERNYPNSHRYQIGTYVTNWNGSAALFHVRCTIDGSSFRLTVRTDGEIEWKEYQR